MARISVIVPTFNRADSLGRVLHFLRRQLLDCTEYDIIVIDDGSTDHTPEVIKRSGLSNLQYQRQTRQGEIKARHLGASLAQNELLAFIDDDIYVAPTYLHTLINAHATDQKRIVVGTIFHYYDPLTAPETLLRSQIEQSVDLQVKEVHYVECSGHSFSITRAGYEEVGGMKPLDDTGRHAWGGIDFAYRAHKLGYRVYRAPLALALHHDYGLQDFDTTARRWERVCAMAVLLMQRYPELQGQIPMLRDKQEIDWRHDDVSLVGRKLVKWLLGTRLPMSFLDWIVTRAPDRWQDLAVHLAAEGHIARGFRNGLRLYGSIPAPPNNGYVEDA